MINTRQDAWKNFQLYDKYCIKLIYVAWKKCQLAGTTEYKTIKLGMHGKPKQHAALLGGMTSMKRLIR